MSAELLLAVGKSFLFAFAAILPILDPAATAPIFLGLAEGASAGTRAPLARRIARNMFALMVGSMLLGSYVLQFFGISLPIVRDVGNALMRRSAPNPPLQHPGGKDRLRCIADGCSERLDRPELAESGRPTPLQDPKPFERPAPSRVTLPISKAAQILCMRYRAVVFTSAP